MARPRDELAAILERIHRLERSLEAANPDFHREAIVAMRPSLSRDC